MVISHKYRFIFIKTRKTAGTSIEVALSQVCDASDVFTRIHPREPGHEPRNHRGLFLPLLDLTGPSVVGGRNLFLHALRGERFYNHMSARCVRMRVSPEIWNGYFKFCVEREPFDKTISHFKMLKHRSGGRMTLDDYFGRGLSCVDRALYLDDRGELMVNRIVRYETLLQELESIFDQLEVTRSSLPSQRSKSIPRDARESDPVTFFSKAHADRIRHDFQWELEHLYRS